MNAHGTIRQLLGPEVTNDTIHALATKGLTNETLLLGLTEPRMTSLKIPLKDQIYIEAYQANLRNKSTLHRKYSTARPFPANMLWDCATASQTSRVSPIEHVKRILGQLKISNTDPQTYVAQFVATLQGTARLWAESVLVDQAEQISWEEMTSLFTERYYTDADQAMYLRQIFTLEQTGSVDKYHEAFRQLMRWLNKPDTDKDLKLTYGFGLQSYIRGPFHTWLYNLSKEDRERATIEDLGRQARTLELHAAQDSRKRPAREDHRERPPSFHCARHGANYSHNTADCRTRHPPLTTRSDADANASSSNSSSSSSSNTSSSSGSSNSGNHNYNNNSARLGNTNTSNTPNHKPTGFIYRPNAMSTPKPVLYTADAEDHIRPELVLHLAGEQTNKSLGEYVSSLLAPIILTTKGQSTKMMGLLDTGNLGRSLIDLSTATDLALRLGESSSIQMANGETTPCKEVLDPVNLSYGKKEISVRLRAIDGLKQDLLIGLHDMNLMGIGIMGLEHHYPDFKPEPEPRLEPPPPLVDECRMHEKRNAILEGVKDLLEQNSKVSGFCPLEESVVRITLREGANDDNLYIPQYPVPQAHRQTVSDKVQEWLDAGKVELQPTLSKCNSPLTPSVKKDGKTGLRSTNPKDLRVNTDLRRLNPRLPDVFFSLPIIAQMFLILVGYAVYSVIDLKDGFCNFMVHPDSRYLLGFQWGGRYYQWVGAPFGLKTMSSHFQRIMTMIFKDCVAFVLVFIDDIIVFSRNSEEHVIHLAQVIDILTRHNLKINVAKSHLGYSDVYVLGHLISQQGLAMDKRKLTGIWNWPKPNASSIEHYLGLGNYFRNFVPKYATIVAPLERVRKVFEWNHEQETAWYQFRLALIQAPTISTPDWSKPFYLATDACKAGIAAILFQTDGNLKVEDVMRKNNNHYYISMYSRATKGAEKAYGATKLEALAGVQGMLKHRNYLIGRKFTWFTDHRALVWLFNGKDEARITNTWLDTIIEYDFVTIHLPGVQLILPDHMSRIYEEEETKRISTGENQESQTTEIYLVTPENPKTLNFLIQGKTYDLSILNTPWNKDPTTEEEILHPTGERAQTPTALMNLMNTLFDFEIDVTPTQPTVDYLEEHWKKRNYCNPPYSMIWPFLRQALLEAIRNESFTIMLLPDWDEHSVHLAKKHLQWFRFEERITFRGYTHPAKFDSLLIGVEPNGARQLASLYPKTLSTRYLKMLQHRKEINDPQERAMLLRTTHELGHFGIDAMIRGLYSRGVQWKGLREDAAATVHDCMTCQRYNIGKRGFHPYTYIMAKLPMDHIAMDLFEFQKSRAGYKYALVLVDICTKFVFLRALKTKQMHLVAATLYALFAEIGFPKIIQCDNGLEFANKVVYALVTFMKTDMRHTTPYNPHANGAAERSVQSAKNTLIKLLQADATEWESKLPQVQFVLNNKVASLHSSTPFSLMFGRQANPFITYDEETSSPFTEEEIIERWKAMHEIVYPATASGVRRKQEKRKLHFDEFHALLPNLPSGSYVMVKPSVRTSKLQPRYEGPYMVIRQNAGGAYILKDMDGLLLARSYAPEQLKPLASKNISDERTWEVAAIHEHRKTLEGENEYLVSWKGFGREDDSWVPFSDFQEHELITQYHNKSK